MSKHVKVKPLEWVAADEDEEDYVSAFSEIGAYSIERLSAGSWELTAELPSGGECSWYVTIEAAKAAAQADYERRILSALEPSPAFEAMVEALEDGRVIAALMRVQQQLDDHIFERENEILRDEEPYPFEDELTVGIDDLLPVSRVIRAALALARGER
jgi:hypothetical protein